MIEYVFLVFFDAKYTQKINTINLIVVQIRKNLKKVKQKFLETQEQK